MQQKFNKDDWVRIANDLGPMMHHFPAGSEAIVIGSYADQYGGDNHKDYTLYLKDSGSCSWYHEHQLTLIEANRADLLQSWETEAEAERKQKSNLDWIFANGPSVLTNPHGSSIQALAECYGLTNLWGSRGEGITYYCNALDTLRRATPYLIAKDKQGWLAYCERLMLFR